MSHHPSITLRRGSETAPGLRGHRSSVIARLWRRFAAVLAGRVRWGKPRSFGYSPTWVDNFRARRRLQQCAVLDPRFTGDIGLTPSELQAICDAPPWKPVGLNAR